MKTKLNIFDRLLLLNILPNNYDRNFYKIYDDFIKELSFSEEEVNEFRCENGEILFNNEIIKEFEIGNKINKIICETLEICKREGFLQEGHMFLYNKFMKDMKDVA